MSLSGISDLSDFVYCDMSLLLELKFILRGHVKNVMQYLGAATF